jgi:hypothetical protein
MSIRACFRTPSLAALLTVCAVLASCTTKSTGILILGNSLTYVGNLPAVLDALCEASNRRCVTDMIVEGGATLSQRVEDHTMTRVVQSGRKFDYLVLQERGGDYIFISSRPQVTTAAESAASDLAAAASQVGMKPLLLGTYQGDPRASDDIVSAEARLAATLKIPHVPVSNYFSCGRRVAPSLRWLDPDGGHPGPDLTLLMAVLLYQELFQTPPSTGPISVHAPIYGPMNGPRAKDFASAQTVDPKIVRTVSYSADTVGEVVKMSQTSCK